MSLQINGWTQACSSPGRAFVGRHFTIKASIYEKDVKECFIKYRNYLCCPDKQVTWSYTVGRLILSDQFKGKTRKVYQHFRLPPYYLEKTKEFHPQNWFEIQN